MRRGHAAVATLALVLACAAPAAAAAAQATGAGGSATGSVVPPLIPATAPFVLTSVLFVPLPQGPAVHVEELVSGENRGSAPLAGLSFPLPPGAVGAALRSGAAAGAFSQQGNRIALRVTVPPGGRVSYVFTYTVSWAGGLLWLPVAYPTETLLVLLPQGRWALAGAGFSPAGRLPLATGSAVEAYGTVAPSPGALLPVRLRRLHWWSRGAVRDAAAAALAAAALALALGAARRRRARRAGRAAELVDALARLDLGRASVGEAAYRARRAELLEDLRFVDRG